MSIFRAASLALRLGAVAIVAGSPWLHPLERPATERSIVYVVDRSASIGPSGLVDANAFLDEAWQKHTTEKLGVVAFDGEATTLLPVGPHRAAPIVEVGKQSQASDIAAGIRLAHAMLPHEGHRSIVLLTDARATRGDAALEVRRAAEEGIRVDVRRTNGIAPALPLLLSVKPRSLHAAESQPVAIDVAVRANRPFLVRWKRDGVPLQPVHHYRRSYNADDEPEDASLALVDQHPPPGVHVYEVVATDYSRDKTEHASALTAVSVEGKSQAIVISGTNDVPPVLEAALSESGLAARALPIERASDPSSYSGADLVVLADVRVSGAANDDTGLTRAAQTALVDYVQQGGGLLVTGGAFGLAPEYSGTPISRILPVEIEDRGHVEDPPVALAIMLDRSGSMGAQVGEHTKIELAIEASLAAADVLRPTDQVALGSVDTETHWNIPLGTVDRVAALRADVRSVTAGGGGILVYTALQDAYNALAPVKMPIRHVILFSDTSDSEEQTCESNCKQMGRTAESLAREARGKGITTTVVGIGEEDAPDVPFLRRLAAASGGRFYVTREGADLRRIFLSETRVLAQSNLRERKTGVQANGAHEILVGIDPGRLPQLSAYVETGMRPGADTPLVIPDPSKPEGRPLVATWRYGLGKAGVLATDLDVGWGQWSASSPAQQLLRQTTRFLLRQNDARRADASVKLHDRVVEVDIQLPADAPESAAPKTMDVWGVSAGGTSHKIPMRLEQAGAGHWVARGRSSGEPIIVARARDLRSALMAEAVGREDAQMEISGEGADQNEASALADVGGGRLDPSPVATLRPTIHPAKALVASWPYALLVAAGLVVLDLLLRRVGAPKRRLKSETGLALAKT